MPPARLITDPARIADAVCAVLAGKDLAAAAAMASVDPADLEDADLENAVRARITPRAPTLSKSA